MGDGRDGKPYEIVVRAPEGTPVIEVSGELDAAAEPDLATALARARRLGARVVIDLRETRFIDARTVDALFAAHAGGAAVAVRGAHGIPRRVLEVTEAFAWMDVVG
jgi:anti-anti-sigma factor